jgi:hypothetical protein
VRRGEEGALAADHHRIAALEHLDGADVLVEADEPARDAGDADDPLAALDRRGDAGLQLAFIEVGLGDVVGAGLLGRLPDRARGGAEAGGDPAVGGAVDAGRVAAVVVGGDRAAMAGVGAVEAVASERRPAGDDVVVAVEDAAQLANSDGAVAVQAGLQAGGGSAGERELGLQHAVGGGRLARGEGLQVAEDGVALGIARTGHGEHGQQRHGRGDQGQQQGEHPPRQGLQAERHGVLTSRTAVLICLGTPAEG